MRIPVSVVPRDETAISDVGDKILELCSRNAETNKPLYSCATDTTKPQDVVRARQLDWTAEQLPTGE